MGKNREASIPNWLQSDSVPPRPPMTLLCSLRRRRQHQRSPYSSHPSRQQELSRKIHIPVWIDIIKSSLAMRGRQWANITASFVSQHGSQYQPTWETADIKPDIVNTVKHFCEGFVFVANDFSLQRPRHSAEAFQPRKKSEEDWVARILEIRASDEHHVYARVYWMYWPEELPRSHYRGKVVQGRQPYHGQHELIASNHSKPLKTDPTLAGINM